MSLILFVMLSNNLRLAHEHGVLLNLVAELDLVLLSLSDLPLDLSLFLPQVNQLLLVMLNVLRGLLSVILRGLSELGPSLAFVLSLRRIH